MIGELLLATASQQSSLSTRLIVKLNEDLLATCYIEAVPKDFAEFKKLLKRMLEKPSTKLTIQREEISLQKCMVYYQFDNELSNQWRLLTDDYRISPIPPRSIYVSIFSFQYIELTASIDKQLNQSHKRGEEQQEIRKQDEMDRMRRLKEQQIPKITFLHGSPMYDINPDKKPFQRPFVYLDALKNMFTAVKDSNMELWLEIQQFNDSNLKRALSSTILYVFVHSEGDYFFGEDEHSALERVRPTPFPIAETGKIDLLIIQSNSPEQLERSIGGLAKKTVLIRSNTMAKDEIAAKFVSTLFHEIFLGAPLTQCYENSCKQIFENPSLSRTLLCCCLHPTKEESRAYQQYQTLLACNCYRHNSEGRIKQGCTEDHSLRNKFSMRPDASASDRDFVKLEPGTTVWRDAVKAYKTAAEKCFKLADSRQLGLLAQFMYYRRCCLSKSKKRVVLNFYGAEGSGKEHMKNMLLTYLTLKKCLTGEVREITEDLSCAQAYRLTKLDKIELVVLDTALRKISNMKEIVSMLSTKMKVIILSTGRIGLELGEMHYECKQLDLQDSFLFVLRELQSDWNQKKNTCRQSLTHSEQDILRQQLKRNEAGKWTCKKLKRIVQSLSREKLKEVAVADILRECLAVPQNELSEELLKIFTNTPNKFRALFLLSLCNKLRQSRSSCQHAMALLGLKVNVDDIMQKKVEIDLRLALKHSDILEFYARMVRMLTAEAWKLLRQEKSRWVNQQGLIDFTSRSPTSLFHAYLSAREDMPSDAPDLRQTTFLQLEVLYDFLRLGFFIEKEIELQSDAIRMQLTELAVLVINLKFLEQKPEDGMYVILRNIDRLKQSNATKLVEELLLEGVSLELQLMEHLTTLVTHHIEAGSQGNVLDLHKKIEQCQGSMHKVQKQLAELPDSSRTKPLLAVIKFNTVLVGLVELTRLDLLTESLESASQRDMTTNSRPVEPSAANKSEKIKDLIKQRKEYEQAGTGCLDQNNLTYLKELVRLITDGNPHLQTKRPDHIPKEVSVLAAYHQLFRSKQMHHSALHNTDNSDQVDLQTAQALIQDYQTLEALPISDSLLRRLIPHQLGKLRKLIKSKLEKKGIMTVLTAYPQNCSSEESSLGVDVEISFNCLKSDRLILEENNLNRLTLENTLRRGSKYICLLFEYTHSDRNLLFYDSTTKDSHEGSVDSLLPSKVQCFSHIDNTIFVCGSGMLAQRIQWLCPASTVVSLSSEAVSDHYHFYIKKLFQQQALIYFIRNLEVLGYRENQVAVLQKFRSQLNYSLTDNAQKLECLNIRISKGLQEGKTERRYSVEPELIRPISETPIDPLQSYHLDGNPVNVYIYSKENQLLSMLKQQAHTEIVYDQPSIIKPFLSYLKSICEKKHLYESGVYTVNWNTRDSEPLSYLEQVLKVSLPILARKKSLIMMQDPCSLFADAYTESSTFNYLNEYLSDHQNTISTLFCRESGTDVAYTTQLKPKNTWYLHSKDFLYFSSISTDIIGKEKFASLQKHHKKQ